MGLRIDVPASIVGCAVDATARRMAEICTVVYSDFEAELAAGRE